MTERRHAAPPRYIELRCRSAFSFLTGASLPEDLVARAAELDYPALALGDRDGVYGVPRFHQAAQRAGLRALVGCALTLEEGVTGLGGYAVRGNPSSLTPSPVTPNPVACKSLYLLVTNRTGYQNLCRLITHTKLRAPKGESVAMWEDLEGNTDGLICLAGGAEGPVGQGVRGLTPNTLEAVVGRLRGLFPGRLYIDLQRHLDADEERLNRTLIDIARHFHISLVATNDVRHAQASGRRLLDVLTCIRHKTTLDAAGRVLLKNAERHLKSPAEMAALFHDLPEAISNTQRIAEQCEFTLADLGYRFPEYPLPPGETPIGYLRALTYAGARERYGTRTPRARWEQVRRQLEHELHIIGRLDLAGYFLIVWDIVRFCREQRILAQGRGSAANSAVCYALGITAVDAVGMELLFERFLSEERGEWPDIDIDLPSGDQRERVIQYVYQRYGDRGAAMTANVITYRTRSAVREVGKALGFSLEQVDRLSTLLRRFEFSDASDDLAKQLKVGGIDPAAARVQRLVEMVQQIQSLPRHLGQHSGGMVIAAGRLDTVVPLEPASMPGRVVVQWDKDDCADLGIIKVDLLGLGMMAVLEDAIPLIREHEGVDVDLAHLPPDDPRTYAMLRKADTIGVFQVESRAQMATLPRLRPERFYDLVVAVAIIRPGPIVGRMVHPYLNRRNGREPVRYAHPDLEPILKRTLGVPLFQEQLLRIAMTLAGFTGGEAEELRRAMGFKRSVVRMQQIEARLRDGMAQRGIAGTRADEIIRSITAFALYGFPESHAASFALLAYASAYLRAHHLAAFTCAMLNNWPLGFYHPATLVKDAQRHGLRVLPIDVTRSGWKCSLEKKGVVGLRGYGVTGKDTVTPNPQPPNPLSLRLGLRYVTGLREAAAHRIEEERKRAPFTSVTNVATRCELRNQELETLAHLGAFAAFDLTRREALWQAAAVAAEPLLKGVTGLGGYGVRGEERRVHGGNQGTGVPRVTGVASGDGPGARLLLSHQETSERRIVRSHQPDSAGGGISAGKHRRGQRQEDTEGLCQLSTDCTGQLARAGNLLDLSGGHPTGAAGGDRTVAGPARLSGATTQPSDSSTRSPLTPNPLPEIQPWGLRGYGVRELRNEQEPLTPNPQPRNPLPEMFPLERTLADYKNSGLTVGPQVMKYLRDELAHEGVLRASDLRAARGGSWVKIAGLVIVRQRPGTAKGFCFITLEDETGTANAVVVPDMFERYRAVIHTVALLCIEGPLQRVDDVIHVRARRLRALALPQHAIGLTGSGYRMRVTAEDSQPDNQQPDNEQPAALPKSHDFR
jgi:error-prone DNA polymerase